MAAESEYPYDDDEEMGDRNCPKCGGSTRSRSCQDCGGEGFSDENHNCGEDCCCCLNPEPGTCSNCEGKGHFNWCPTCGWDLVEKRYINGQDERAVPS
jgi:hypothetical protein